MRQWLFGRRDRDTVGRQMSPTDGRKSVAKTRKPSSVVVHQAAGSAWSPGMSLLLVGKNRWSATFEVSPSDTQGHTLVALRTLGGAGEIILRDAQTEEQSRLKLTDGSLVFFDEANLEHYRTVGDYWETHWYDFVAENVAVLPFNEPLHIDVGREERKAFDEIAALLTDESVARRRVATANFVLLVSQWLDQSPATADRIDDETACVERAIAEMRANVHEMIGIDRIARAAGASPQALRKLFARIVGLSPKKFYMRLRMNKAYQLLQSGKSVAETSELLGFSSPFHFSRAFRAFHQIPPKTKKGKPPMA